jgi:hypothetical protein
LGYTLLALCIVACVWCPEAGQREQQERGRHCITLGAARTSKCGLRVCVCGMVVGVVVVGGSSSTPCNPTCQYTPVVRELVQTDAKDYFTHSSKPKASLCPQPLHTYTQQKRTREKVPLKAFKFRSLELNHTFQLPPRTVITL